jgi:hypothetical protein
MRCSQIPLLIILLAIGCSVDRVQDLDVPRDSTPFTCQTAISGDSPFGVKVSGTATLFSDNGGTAQGKELGEAQIEFDLFFPNGRRAGAPALLATRSACKPGALNVYGVNGDAMGGTIDVGGWIWLNEFNFHGMLSGDTIRGTAGMNVAEPSTDVGEYGTGQLTLCAAGSPSAATLVPVDEMVYPTQTAWFVPGAPVDLTDVHVSVASSGHAVKTEVVQENGLIGVRPIASFPPGIGLTFDFSGSRDVIGRSLIVTAPQAATTSTVVSDLTFASAPPAGAVVPPAEVVDGRLELYVLGSYQHTDRPFNHQLVALGDHSGPQQLAKLSLSCWYEWKHVFTSSLGLIDATGNVEPIPIKCDYTDEQVTVVLPGTGPFWLELSIPKPEKDCPQSFGAPPLGVFVRVDEILFL